MSHDQNHDVRPRPLVLSFLQMLFKIPCFPKSMLSFTQWLRICHTASSASRCSMLMPAGAQREGRCGAPAPGRGLGRRREHPRRRPRRRLHHGAGEHQHQQVRVSRVPRLTLGKASCLVCQLEYTEKTEDSSWLHINQQSWCGLLPCQYVRLATIGTQCCFTVARPGQYPVLA